MTHKTFTLIQPTDTHTCSYLPNQQARSLYVDPNTELSLLDLTLLSMNGFRRSGRLVYRPNCPSCNACQPVRIHSRKFKPSRSQQRVLSRNKDLTLSVVTPNNSAAIYALYQHYITKRHHDGEMFPPTEQQFLEFLCMGYGNSGFLLAHQQHVLKACMVFDIFQDGLSAVYCFFDPDAATRSLGSFMLIRLTQLSQLLNLPYNYLGYLVDDSPKMNYKRHFKPLEVLHDGCWQAI